jgi:hypothetical protein
MILRVLTSETPELPGCFGAIQGDRGSFGSPVQREVAE